MKKVLIWVVGALGILGMSQPVKAQWNSGNFISEGIFVNINSMSASEIQLFLDAKKSFLKDFNENGRSVAQIIFDAAMGRGEASATMNDISITTATGTVNPQIILATLQKEQSLITKTSRDDNALNKAMGFGCPDSGSCNPAYTGFTKQVENGAWQLRYNYERSQGRGQNDYQVGQTMNFDGFNVFLANRAVASLYRYTPHLSGNLSFTNLFSSFFNLPLYGFSWQNQGPWEGSGSWGNPLAPGQKVAASVYFKNSGSFDWTNSGDNAVKLGTSWPIDRTSKFVNTNRVAYLKEARVVPGATGTFEFTAWAPAAPGVYIEHFDPLIEGIKWVGTGLNWTFIVGDPLSGIGWVEQGPKTADAKIHLQPGESATLWVKLRNLSSANWYSDVNETAYIMHLGTSHPRDRASVFLGSSNLRTNMRERGVAFGDLATFEFTITAPTQKGEYREYFDPLVEGYGWFDTHLHWDIVVE